jgi:hypothetical protein
VTPPENPRQPEDSASKEVRDLGGGAAGSLDDAFAAFGATAPKPKTKTDEAKSLDVDDSLSFEDAVQQAAAEGLGRVDAGVSEEQDSPLLDADLDRIEGHAAREGAMRGREDMFAATDADVRARQEAAATRELAESAYDESVMGGVYVGAFAGALIGLLLYKFDFAGRAMTVAAVAVGLALVGALCGYGLGSLIGRGARAAVSSHRGSSVMLSLGIVLLAAPLITLAVALIVGLFKMQIFIGIGAVLLIAFGSFVYVYQDASYRGMGSGAAVSWGLLCAVCPPLMGMHAARRPKGEMVDCSSCDKKMLAHLPACPHCGYRPKAGQMGEEELDLDQF